jgi:agmatine/peptidylarginine deiminase
MTRGTAIALLAAVWVVVQAALPAVAASHNQGEAPVLDAPADHARQPDAARQGGVLAALPRPEPGRGRKSEGGAEGLQVRIGPYRRPASGMSPLPPPLESLHPEHPVDWLRVPAEFEAQEALLLPAGLLAERAPDTLTRVVTLARQRTTLIGIVANAQQRAKVEQALAAAGLLPKDIELVEVPHNTMWLRDYGPIFVKLHDRHRAVVDAEYPERGRSEDDVLPGKIAPHFHADVIPAAIVFEGGNLLSNGCGLFLTTTAIIFRNSDRDHAEARVRETFHECFGSTQTMFLEPLIGEQTGHVDMFACFTAPETVVVGSYDPLVDPLNAAVLDRNAARLTGLSTPRGELHVVRVPMPPHHDGVWRTYTNVVFANHAVLVPIYPGVDSAGATKALETFARLLPGRKVFGVDCRSIIRNGGALRCISAVVPADAAAAGDQQPAERGAEHAPK